MKLSQKNQNIHKLQVGGVVAASIPTLSELLGGLGSISLPAISGASIAASLPIALTLAGPVSEIYNTVTGRHPMGKSLTPQEEQARVYSPDATRVSKPIIVSRIRVGNSGRTEPIGNMYINPSLTRSRAVDMASDSIKSEKKPVTENTSQGESQKKGSSNSEHDQEPDQKDKKGGFVSGFKEGWSEQMSGYPSKFGRSIGRFLGRTTKFTSKALPIAVGTYTGIRMYNNWNSPDTVRVPIQNPNTVVSDTTHQYTQKPQQLSVTPIDSSRYIIKPR